MKCSLWNVVVSLASLALAAQAEPEGMTGYMAANLCNTSAINQAATTEAVYLLEAEEAASVNGTGVVDNADPMSKTASKTKKDSDSGSSSSSSDYDAIGKVEHVKKCLVEVWCFVEDVKPKPLIGFVNVVFGCLGTCVVDGCHKDDLVECILSYALGLKLQIKKEAIELFLNCLAY